MFTKITFFSFFILWIPFCYATKKENNPITLKQEIQTPTSDDEPIRVRFVPSDTGFVVIPAPLNPMDEIDSIIQNEDEIIAQIFFEEGKHDYPSYVWYLDNFSDKQVRLSVSAIDSLPDEILINLIKKNESPFCFPVKNNKTSSYGWRWKRPHRGIDIRLRTGDPVYCCFDGVVRVARRLGNYGNLVVVRHYNGLETVYAHLSKIDVKPKQIIKAGTVLGLGGSTGRSTGPHLHFEVRFQYEPFDPEWILDFNTYSLRVEKLYLNRSYFGIQQPKGNKDEYLAYKADESKYPDPPKKEGVYHTVLKGEDVFSIAFKYKMTQERLTRINRLVGEIFPGQILRIR